MISTRFGSFFTRDLVLKAVLAPLPNSSFQLYFADYSLLHFGIPTQLQSRRDNHTPLPRVVPRQFLTPYFSMGNFISGIAFPGRIEQPSRNENAIPTLIDSLNAAKLNYGKDDLGRSRLDDMKIAEHTERLGLLEAAKELVAVLENPEIAVLEIAKWVRSSTWS